jgi:hypothetical protein
MTTRTADAVEMLNKLIRRGYVAPMESAPGFVMPSAYLVSGLEKDPNFIDAALGEGMLKDIQEPERPD